MPRPCRTGHHQYVGGHGAGRAADQRVDVQRVQGVAEVAGEPGQRGDRVRDRAKVSGGLAAATSPLCPPPTMMSAS